MTLYRSGATLSAIGDLYGLTRQRVQQLLSKYHGITAKDGGHYLLSQRKKSAVADLKDAAAMLRYGVTHDELIKMRKLGDTIREAGGKHPIAIFTLQRAKTKFYGQEWGLSLKEWWRVWEESGMWWQYGRPGYALMRKDTSLGFIPGNVEIRKVGWKEGARRRGSNRD